MKKVKVKKLPRKRKMYNGGIFEEDANPNSMTIQGTNLSSTPTEQSDGKLYNTVMNKGVGAAQTLAGVTDAVATSKTGETAVGVSGISGALRGGSLGAKLGGVAGPIGSIVGGGIGAVAGFIGNAVNAHKKNKELAESKKLELDRERELNDSHSRGILNGFPSQGIKDSNYYMAMGGKIKYMAGGNVAETSPMVQQYAAGDGAPPGVNPMQGGQGGQPPQEGGGGMPVEGGETVPIANGVETVEGPKHEQGGVDIGSETEVEGGEVLQNTEEGINVFSDRLEYSSGVTYAQRAEKLGELKGEAEKAMADATSIFAKNSGKRKMQKLDLEMKRLFDAQESMKAAEGIENEPGEAGLGDTITKALPYVDNIGNAILTSKTPEIPAPVYDKAAAMKTNFNINPQLEQINKQQANTQVNLESNVSNSGALRNNMIASGAMATGERNKLYGQKENTETQLINQDRLNRQQVNASNVQKENQYNLNKMNRVDDIHQRISANMANASTDAQMQIAEENLKRKDKLTFAVTMAKYKESGVYDRNMQKMFDDYMNGDAEWADVQTEFNRLKDNIKKKDGKKDKKKKKNRNEDNTPEPVGMMLSGNSALSSKYGFFQND